MLRLGLTACSALGTQPWATQSTSPRDCHNEAEEMALNMEKSELVGVQLWGEAGGHRVLRVTPLMCCLKKAKDRVRQ